jgi:Asp-tRNA(Asn)/Glu-tRNA(Gln) amidotransferase B subunit
MGATRRFAAQVATGVVANNPTAVEEFMAGNRRAADKLVGEVIHAVHGDVPATAVRQMVLDEMSRQYNTQL